MFGEECDEGCPWVWVGCPFSEAFSVAPVVFELAGVAVAWMCVWHWGSPRFGHEKTPMHRGVGAGGYRLYARKCTTEWNRSVVNLIWELRCTFAFWEIMLRNDVCEPKYLGNDTSEVGNSNVTR